MEEMKKGGIITEGQQYVWKGAIPLQIHLHDSEVTTLPHPPPALILAPRLGYLPLLISQIKPFFTSALPPGVDTVWFEYKGLPLKWYIPTGVLFDLLCAEPERPWNLTIHFRGYPGQVLTPCEGEDSVKWSFINTLKEAAYIITGNSKTIMNMSQTDQTELWRSVLNGRSEVYHRISSKLKLGVVGDELSKSRQSSNDSEAVASTRTGKIPVRLYIRNIDVDLDDFEDEPNIDNWDNVAYINRPVEIPGEEGKLYTLLDAVKELLPELFEEESATDTSDLGAEKESEQQSEDGKSSLISSKAKIKLIRIQGIEPQLEIPFRWVARKWQHGEFEHPYIPRDVKLPGFVPTILSQSTILSCYVIASVLSVSVTWILSGYFVFSPEFYKKTTSHILAEIWKEYSKGDSRYGILQ